MSRAKQERKRNPRYAVCVPEEIDIQLTHRCNLRCRHCYQWNDHGVFRDFEREKQNTEIDTNIVEKLLNETRDVKSNLFFWGGEPIIHREWEAITRILEKDPRWTVMCTNGLLLEEKMESILRISSNLAILISVDGFREQHDCVRGGGTFDRTMHNVKLILRLKEKGQYKGAISVACFLSDGMANKLCEFTEYCEDLGVDTLYFAFPWYISKGVSQRMDEYFASHLAWLGPPKEGQKPSWYSYSFHVDPSTIDILQSQIKKLNSRLWKIRIRLHPALEPHEIENFLLGKDQTALNRCQCLAISNRMEVFPDGRVCACKFFPEFTIGNLHKQSVLEIWHSERFNRFREIINRELMPVCSKCVLLYLNGQ